MRVIYERAVLFINSFKEQHEIFQDDERKLSESGGNSIGRTGWELVLVNISMCLQSVI